MRRRKSQSSKDDSQVASPSRSVSDNQMGLLEADAVGPRGSWQQIQAGGVLQEESYVDHWDRDLDD